MGLGWNHPPRNFACFVQGLVLAETYKQLGGSFRLAFSHNIALLCISLGIDGGNQTGRRLWGVLGAVSIPNDIVELSN